jgi:two-component system cell cycle sensor histidine kinase/response regulator CckA
MFNAEPINVLIMEDDPGLARLFQKRLERMGYSSDIACDGKEGLEMYEKRNYDIIALDQNMPGYDGLEVIRILSSKGQLPPLVMVTGAGDEKTAVEAMKLGALDYIVKDKEGQYLELLPSVFQRVLNQKALLAEKRRIEDALKESEKRLRDLFENTNDLIQSVSPDGHFLYVNHAWLNSLKYSKEEILQLSLSDIIHPKHRDRYMKIFKRLLSGETFTNIETSFISKDGKEIMLEGNINCKFVNNQPVQTRGIFRNISKRKELEKEKEIFQSLLFQSQKMESIGRLAGGVAHEFNNLLTAIIGFSELLQYQVDANSPLMKDIESIKKAAKDAASLSSQLLTFSRTRKVRLETMDINNEIHSIEKMLPHVLGENINIEVQLDPELNKVKSDMGLLEQLIVNLIINARDAMPDGGTITIKTENKSLGKNDFKDNLDARPGEFVCLSVKDTGVGMDEDIIHRMFEPFFSTKEVGKGTGLGLSVVHGIVKQHDGWITVESGIDNGTIFRIFLPVSTQQSLSKIKQETHLLQKYNGNGERILLVEDSQQIRELATRVLRESGYVVFPAANSKEAMEAFENGSRFNLIFTDVVMPGGNGPDLVERLLARKPKLKVLFSSGYDEDRSQMALLKQRGYKFLQKPYTPTDLLLVIKEVIEKGNHNEKCKTSESNQSSIEEDNSGIF